MIGKAWLVTIGVEAVAVFALGLSLVLAHLDTVVYVCGWCDIGISLVLAWVFMARRRLNKQIAETIRILSRLEDTR